MQARFYKELKPVSREWFSGCLVIELDNQYFYVNRGVQIEPLTKKTFDLTKSDLEPITREQAVTLVPKILPFLETPELPLLFSRRLG